MKNLLLLFVLLFSAGFLDGQIDTRLKGLDNEIEEILEIANAAGLSIAIIEKDELIYADGFGFSDYEKQVPVDANTMFAIGSSTKAFTSALLGQLRDETDLSFEEKPSKYIPELEFFNDEMNSNIIISDLMCHRTGLPRHDLSWYFFPTASKDSLIERIKFHEPFTGVRQRWYYNNFMFLAQGVITEKITGKSWEQNIRERFFNPLEMKRSATSVDELGNYENVSIGYYTDSDGSIKKMDYYDISGMSPAGSIYSCANDLSKWLICWINKGKYNEQQLIPASYVDEAISAQMAIGGGLPGDEYPDIHFSGYGYGWQLKSYSGHYRVSHGGNIDGFSAEVAFFPADSLGIAILVNQNGSAVNNIVRNTIADRMLGIKGRDWVGKFRERTEKMKASQNEIKEGMAAGKISGTKPSHGLHDYTGTYENPGYGKFRITLENDSLIAHFKLMKLWLRHVHYDIFEPYEIKEDGKVDTSAGSFLKLNFHSNETGDISSLSSKIEPTLDPIKFDRTPILIEVSNDELEKYTGDYNLMGNIIKVYIKDEALYLFVQGQPEYELISTGKHKFNFKILDGFKVEFNEDESGNITDALLIQPHGNYTIKKE